MVQVLIKMVAVLLRPPNAISVTIGEKQFVRNNETGHFVGMSPSALGSQNHMSNEKELSFEIYTPKVFVVGLITDQFI